MRSYSLTERAFLGALDAGDILLQSDRVNVARLALLLTVAAPIALVVAWIVA